MTTPKNDDGAAVALDAIVRPFVRDATAQWRRRAEVMTALINIHDNAEEIQMLLGSRGHNVLEDDWEETLDKAREVLAEMHERFLVLWPNKQITEPERMHD